MRAHIMIAGCQGYAPDQVSTSLTVGQLRERLEDFDDDMIVVICDVTNRYGAKWGKFLRIEEDDNEEEA